MKTVREAVLQLYQALEDLAADHEELSDTDVREQLAETLAWYFVWNKPTDVLPRSYGMFTEEGDEAVRRAVERFLKAALPLATAERLAPGRKRHDVLQDKQLLTRGKQRYDAFIGHAAAPAAARELPDYRFEPDAHGEFDELGSD